MDKKIILIALFAVVAGIGSVAVFNHRDLKEPKISYVSNAFIELTPDEIVKQSNGIVLGSVENIQVIKANSRIRSGEEDILTKVTIKVEKYLSNPKEFSGDLAAPTIDVEVIGGTFGNETMVSDGSPTFEKGERVAVFLGPEDTNTNAFTVYAGPQGKFSVLENNIIGNEKEKVFVNKLFGRGVSLNELESMIMSVSKAK